MAERIKAPAGSHAFLKQVFEACVPPAWRDRTVDLCYTPKGEIVQVCRTREIELRGTTVEEGLVNKPGKGFIVTICRPLAGEFADVTLRTVIEPDDTITELSASPNKVALDLEAKVPAADIDEMLQVVSQSLGVKFRR